LDWQAYEGARCLIVCVSLKLLFRFNFILTLIEFVPSIAIQSLYRPVQGDCEEYREFLGSSRVADHNEVESVRI